MSCHHSARLPFALCALAALVAPGARAQFQDFTGWTGIDVGTPQQVQFAQEFERADLDGDGHPDLAVVSWGVSQHKLSILRNLGDETFAPPVHYPLLKGGMDLAVADFDGDGDPDIAVTEGENFATGTTVAIFRNAGDASFALGQRVTVPKGPRGIAACDYDGDGDRDLAVAIYGVAASGTSIKLLVNAGGSFSAGASVTVPVAPACLAAADLDDDGRQDLAVGHDGTDVITVLRAAGATFAAPLVFDVKASTESGSHLFSSIGLADLDRDGDLDIAFSDNTHQKTLPGLFLRGIVTTVRNLGGGAFALGPDIVLRSGASGFTDMDFADLNADGWPDVLGTDHQDWDYALSDGAGGWQMPAGINYGYLGTDEPTAIAALDADHDGDLDALVLGSHSVALTVHRLQDGAPQQGSVATGPDGDIDAADIDGDGDLDLAGGGGGPIHVLRNLGDGSFGPDVTYPSSAFGGPKAVRLRDLNGDGFPDLVIGALSGFNTKLNLGNGNFGALVQWNLPICGLDDLDLVDLDGDGDLDVVIPESAGCPTVPFPRVFVIESNGDGTFVQPTGPAFTTGLSTGVAHGDLDGDGHQDLILAQNSWLEVRLGTGSLQTFSAPILAPAAWAPHGIAVADLDGDDIPDLASCNWGGTGNDFSSETLSVMLGFGDGTFSAPQILACAASWDLGSASAIQSGDIDRDGDIDLAVGNFDSHDVSLFRNDGSGHFLPETRVGGALYLTDIVLADFTGDGIDDLALAGQPALITTPGVVILRGLGERSVAARRSGAGGQRRPAAPGSRRRARAGRAALAAARQGEGRRAGLPHPGLRAARRELRGRRARAEPRRAAALRRQPRRRVRTVGPAAARAPRRPADRRAELDRGPGRPLRPRRVQRRARRGAVSAAPGAPLRRAGRGPTAWLQSAPGYGVRDLRASRPPEPAMKLLAACVLSLALLPACASSGTAHYFSNRGGDLVDIVRGHLILGPAIGARVEVTRMASLGYVWEDRAWAGGLHNRAVGQWHESIASWGLIVGQHDERAMEGIPAVSGDYGWFGGEHSVGYSSTQPDNPLDLLTVRGTVALILGADLELRVGEAVDFLFGLFTIDPAGDDQS